MDWWIDAGVKLLVVYLALGLLGGVVGVALIIANWRDM